MKIGWATSDRTPARGRILKPRRDEEGLEAPHQQPRPLPPYRLWPVSARSVRLASLNARESLFVSAHPVEEKALLAPFDRPEAAALAPPFDVVERGQRLVVGA